MKRIMNVKLTINNFLQTFFFTVIFFFLLLLITKFTFAQNTLNPGITISPAIFDLNVKRGKKFKEVIYVTNDSEFSMPVTIDINDYSVDEYGAPDYTEDESDWSPKGWIEIANSDMILEPGEKRKVTLKFSIPKSKVKAEAGSHFATVLFKPIIPPEYLEEDSTHVTPYIGAIVALNIPGENGVYERKEIEIEDFKTKEQVNTRYVEFETKLINEDVYYHKVNGEITIRNVFGKESGKMPVEEITIFPQKNLYFNDEFDRRLFGGYYRAEMSLNDTENQYLEKTAFWVIPSLFTIFVFLILLITIIFLFIFRKNLFRAIKVLLGKSK